MSIAAVLAEFALRIHVQNSRLGPDPFDVTLEQFSAACGRAAMSLAVPSFGRSEAEFAQGLAAADILIASPGTLASLLPLPPNHLRVIFLLAAGIDRLAPFGWLPTGAAVWNNRGAHGAKAGAFGLMAVTMLAARMPHFAENQRKRRWEPAYTPALTGRRLTIIGTGDLGASVARQARHAGLIVTAVNRSGASHAAFDRVVPVRSLDEILSDSEFLLLACPLTPETKGLVTRARLERLPAGACVVNIARGAILDQAALIDLLHAGRLGGALLDVTSPEPPAEDDPVWSAPNLILTPHVSADDPVSYNAASLDIFLANLKAHLAGGVPANLVDLARGY